MSKNLKNLSAKLWPILVELAENNKTCTYSEIASEMNTHWRMAGKYLAPIYEFCGENNYPMLTALVVSKGTGKPSIGFNPDGYDYDLEKIYQFNWRDVYYSPAKISLQQFIDFVKIIDGETLKTPKKARLFHISINNEYIIFTPDSTGWPRKVPLKTDIEGNDNRKGYLQLYNEGYRRANDYQIQTHKPGSHLMNASYFLAVMTEYEKPQNAIFRDNEAKEIQKDALINARKGQGKFRKNLLNYWQNSCAVSKVRHKKLLIASYIKPWQDADNQERLDKFNGLLLTPNLSALFNQGLITFDDNKKIRISRKISKENLKKLGISSAMVLQKIEKGHKQFLKYHRKEIFEN